MAEPATTTTENKEGVDIAIEAIDLLAKGKRNMVCGEIPDAVNQLQEACALLAAKYGETADECGEAYLCYGKSLLDLARMESGVLGNALQGVSEDTEDESTEASPKDDKVENPENVPAEEREKISDDVYDAMTEVEREKAKNEAEKKKAAADDAATKDKKSEDVEMKDEAKSAAEEKPKEQKEVQEKEDKKKDSEKKEKEAKDSVKVAEKDAKAKDSGKDVEKDAKAKDSGKDVEKKAKDSDKDAEKDAKAKDSGKDVEKKAKDSDKDAEKDAKAKDSGKDVEKDAKDSGKDAEKDAKAKDSGKDVDKEAKDSDKDAEKEAKDSGKDAEKEVKDSDKDAEKEEDMETDKKAEGKKEGDTEEDEEEEEEEGEEADEGTEEDAGEGTSSGEKKEEEEDVGNLQLAWEMLELAKVIFTRGEAKEQKLKKAECSLHLGEVGLETEQYEQAVGDFTECLKEQNEHLTPENRILAETHYQLGLAYCYSGQYDPSIENYKKAVAVIEAKIAKNIKYIEEMEAKTGKEPTEPGSENPVTTARKEVNDLKEILPDIKAKIEDTEEEKKNSEKVKQLVKDNVASDMGGTTTTGFGEASTSASSEVKPIAVRKTSNVSHLVKKKRKPEEEADKEEGEAPKKARQEEEPSSTTTNGKAAKNGSGDAPVNGQVNGNGKEASPDKAKEIKVKTVEDVKKAGEEKMETAPAESTS